MARPSTLTWRSFLTVEPVLLLYAYSFFMSMPLQRQYVYYRYSMDTGFPYDLKTDKGSSCGSSEGLDRNITLSKMENEVQELAGKFDARCAMFQVLPSLIMGLFIGPWTDTGGRKLALIFPLLGAILESVLLISMMYFSLPIYLIYVGKAVNGLTGFFSTMAQVSMSYLADICEPSQISFRLAIMQLLIFVGGFVSQIFSGVALTTFGFIPPYVSILVCSLTAFLYLVFFVPESLPHEKRSTRPLFTVSSLKRVLSIYTKPRGGNRRNLLLLLFSDGVFIMIAMGTNAVMALFLLRNPLCFTPTMLGVFVAFKFAAEGLGGILGMMMMNRFLRDETVLRVCLLSLAAAMALLAFSHNMKMVFLVPVISSLSGPMMPSLKGMMSKLVLIEEQGSLFTAVSAVESLCMVLGAITFNSVYIRSIEAGFPGMVFLICAGILILPAILLGFLQKQKED